LCGPQKGRKKGRRKKSRRHVINAQNPCELTQEEEGGGEKTKREEEGEEGGKKKKEGKPELRGRSDHCLFQRHRRRKKKKREKEGKKRGGVRDTAERKSYNGRKGEGGGGGGVQGGGKRKRGGGKGGEYNVSTDFPNFDLIVPAGWRKPRRRGRGERGGKKREKESVRCSYSRSVSSRKYFLERGRKDKGERG